MKRALACWLLLCGAVARGDVWTPPEKPNPQHIREEARQDVRARRYDVALAKYVWYYENAAKYDPALSAVRLSFGLGDWGQLADLYPPALEKMKQARDELKERILKSERVAFEDFHSLTALDRELDDDSATIEAFLALDARSPRIAKKVFRVAEPALVRAKEYTICGKYLDPEQGLEEISRSLSMNQAMVKDGKLDASHLRYTEKKFLSDSALLVALLVKNERQEEAETLATELKKVSTDPKLSDKLDAALTKALSGVVPEPWP